MKLFYSFSTQINVYSAVNALFSSTREGFCALIFRISRSMHILNLRPSLLLTFSSALMHFFFSIFLLQYVLFFFPKEPKVV